ncbi:MAG: hypothetical protein KGK44_08205, partial [Gammaproteobacteria bacterium]|nr:hypothetical protein [Gammaproteobacteria bacterium]
MNRYLAATLAFLLASAIPPLMWISYALISKPQNFGGAGEILFTFVVFYLGALQISVVLGIPMFLV